jgi:hypothetical protein
MGLRNDDPSWLATRSDVDTLNLPSRSGNHLRHAARLGLIGDLQVMNPVARYLKVTAGGDLGKERVVASMSRGGKAISDLGVAGRLPSEQLHRPSLAHQWA